MLTQPTLNKLEALKLTGMLRAYQEQLESGQCGGLSFDERFALLLEREAAEQDNRRLKTRLKSAGLRQAACAEDVDYRTVRGLDKGLMQSLLGCDWLRKHHNCLITGPTGTGKSRLACALGHQACRQGFRVRYYRTPRFFQELAVARGVGHYQRALRSQFRAGLLILDDWGTALLSEEQRLGLFEVMEDRYDRRATLIAAQLPVQHWRETIGDPTLADAILDRLIHNAYTIALKGESMQQKEETIDFRWGMRYKKRKQLNRPRRYAPIDGRHPVVLVV